MHFEVLRLILENHFSICVGSEKHLTGRGHKPAVEVMRLEDIGVIEVAQAATTLGASVIHREVCHETSKVL